MAIVRWLDPFRDLSAIQERMNQIFEDALARSRGREEGLRTGMWTPAVDIYENSDFVVVKAELPGVEKNQISVEVKDGILSLRGERKFEKEVKEESFHRIERSYGSFQRSFSLPVSVDQDQVTARFEDGVLEVKLPKKEKAKPKQIQVDVK
ncbi:MAG: Hsp20/alpha crystallin family protein [Deltaproteobacteria bacterium]|jgi:HSP20 family protein|nr:Hsp20/alpha crystallin family protein [Deltaproteobacteria bacterium]TFG60676.1 MAG: Hsp20/alpha crystallin family protein [Deltaproteobacteria bacterium]